MTRVYIDARLAVRGLGIASAVERLTEALKRHPDTYLTVNCSANGWTRRGKLETLARTGLLDLNPRLDPRTRGVDVVHYFGNTCPRLPDPRTLVTVHDLMMLGSQSLNGRLFKRLLVPGLRKQRARVVAISSHTADSLVAQVGLASSQIEVIPHGYRDLPIWDGARSHVLMFGGSGDPRKRIDLGIRAYDFYARRAGGDALPLVIMGRGGVTREHVALATHGSIRIEANPDRKATDTLLSRAACLLYPSAWEGFGLPILEAGEVGTPVVYDSRADIPREPLGSHAFPAAEASAESFAVTLESAIAGGTVHNAMAGHPSWHEVAARYVEIYREVTR